MSKTRERKPASGNTATLNSLQTSRYQGMIDEKRKRDEVKLEIRRHMNIIQEHDKDIAVLKKSIENRRLAKMRIDTNDDDGPWKWSDSISDKRKVI